MSGEVDVRASPAQVLDVLADLAQYPAWSAVHKRAQVDERYPDGRPKRATMAVAAAGRVDEQVLDYTWRADGVQWKLTQPTSQQRDQHGSYALTAAADGPCHVRYELDISPALPLPGLLVRRVMRSALVAATAGLRDRVESLSRA